MQDGVNKLPKLLRTYATGTEPPDHCTIVDAARATCATATFFPPATFQYMYGVPVTYLDGRLNYNNPTQLAVDEADSIWRDREIGCIVSIGTGISSLVKFQGNKLELARMLVNISTDCQRVDQQMDQRFHRRTGKYFRFDPPQDLAKIGLDEWKKLDEVGRLAVAYIEGAKVRFDDCVAAITHPVRAL